MGYGTVASLVLRKPLVILQLMELTKSGTHPLEYQRLYAEIQGQFEDHFSIYTDGFKDDGHVAAAAVCWQKNIGVRLPDQSSIFTAEARALCLALVYIEDSNYTNYFINSICSLACRPLLD